MALCACRFLSGKLSTNCTGHIDSDIHKRTHYGGRGELSCLEVIASRRVKRRTRSSLEIVCTPKEYRGFESPLSAT
jgi:hypothetical protein